MARSYSHSVSFVGIAPLMLLLLTQTGCPASQTWTTARTIPKGEVQHTVGAEVLGFNVDVCSDDEQFCLESDTDVLAAPFPAYVIRYGLADNMDIGGKFSTTGQVSGDLKVQLVRGETFEFALDPSLATTFSYMNLAAPLLFSFNLDPKITFTVSPKLSYQFIFSDGDYLADGFFVGGGANLQYRLNEKVAITPGFDIQTMVAGPIENVSATYFSIGAAVSFGGLPY